MIIRICGGVGTSIASWAPARSAVNSCARTSIATRYGRPRRSGRNLGQAPRICRPPDRVPARSSRQPTDKTAWYMQSMAGRRRGRPCVAIDQLAPWPEKLRKLVERDRPLVVEGAGRMTLIKELCERKTVLWGGRKFTQVDLALPAPSGSYRRQGRHDGCVRINSAHRIGVPAFSAACAEQKIMKIPENQVGVAFGGSQAALVGPIDLEQHLAIQQHGEKLDSWAAFLSANRFTCCGVESRASAVTMCGLQIRNSAPARGNSSTITSPRGAKTRSVTKREYLRR